MLVLQTRHTLDFHLSLMVLESADSMEGFLCMNPLDFGRETSKVNYDVTETKGFFIFFLLHDVILSPTSSFGVLK
jgi:hypothetical protein